MNEKEKSLGLARLMGIVTEDRGLLCVQGTFAGDQYNGMPEIWQPYAQNKNGLAQFAAILLRFPDVMHRFGCCEAHDFDEIAATQTNILDEILRMNEVEL